MLEPFTPGFVRRLQQLKIHTRRAFLGSRQGIHRSTRRGHGLEFSDFRVYTPGDDFRHIDWGVLARTDRLYVRQFREERDLQVSVLLDGSASMALPEGEGKFEMARNLALSLGYVALTDGDLVTFDLIGQKESPRFRGPRAISRAHAFLHSVQPGGNIEFAAAVRAAVARQKAAGKAFVISDFLFDENEQIDALDALRYRNFDASVIQVLAPSELKLGFDAGSYQVIDAETGEEVEIALSSASRKEYAKILAEHIQMLEHYCQKHGIRHVLVSSDEDVADVVLSRLPALGLLS